MKCFSESASVTTPTFLSVATPRRDLYQYDTQAEKSSLFLCLNLKTARLQSVVPAELLSRKGTSVLQMWPTQVWTFEENCSSGGFTFHSTGWGTICSHETATQMWPLLRIYPDWSCRKYCRETLLSCILFPQDETTTQLLLLLPWKPGHSHSFTHSLSPLASLSALLLAIRIKPAAELAVLKCSLQLNTFK